MRKDVLSGVVGGGGGQGQVHKDGPGRVRSDVQGWEHNGRHARTGELGWVGVLMGVCKGVDEGE